MILAAGLGTRMAPLTAHHAKPTLPVLDEPLLLRLVRALAAQGVDHVVVNAHALADQVRKAVSGAPVPVEVSFEPELLGSGGGIRRAQDRLASAGTFLVLNGDMCVDVDVAAWLDAHRRLGTPATLVLRDDARKREFGTIGYVEGGLVSRITSCVGCGSETGSGLFTGIHVMEPELLERMPGDGRFDIVADVYAPMLRAGDRLGSCLQPTSAIWWPVGTPRELLDANLRMLVGHDASGQVPDDASIEGLLRPPVFIGAGARVAPGAVAGPHAVIGAGAQLQGEARESLLLPGATPPPGTSLHRAIAFDTEVWRDA